ncbi:MAG: hypothetical protein ACQESR_23725, partial [Planctomycetota bacterium]
MYTTSRDLKTFADPPRELFQWDMATIDTIVRRIGDRHYAVIKDERYPSLDWPTGKTIRVSTADDLLGPYSKPPDPRARRPLSSTPESLMDILKRLLTPTRARLASRSGNTMHMTGSCH